MIIGERIRNIREDEDILQQELADAVGINVSVLSRIEKGTRQLRDDELIKIADKLNVSVDYLLGRTDEPQGTGFQKGLLGDINGDSPLAQKAREATTNGWLPMSKAENPEAEKALEWLEKYNKLDINDKNTINSMIDIALRSKENKQSNE
ncbi:helix-turn-helix domain-containing protein [Selenomonas ruminantium]|uniref:helix-turn-helix domain-containing protein n=1 Tax=Selenomonas ruminantium TaxID=971 RepID=UPI0008FFC85B|nr:helix-turn-helix transcriptional regulator [Selenomonas ruminantium]